MNDALNHPVVRRGRQKEVHTGDMAVPQKESQILDGLTAEDRIEHSAAGIMTEVPSKQDYHDQLAYAEQPITIRIERSSEKNAPRFAECYVNGRGAEVLQNGKWMSVGWLPCGIPITTKRKYAEVLMRSRPDDVETEVYIPDGQDPINRLNWQTRQKFPISIIKDDHPIDPMGMEWATRIMSEH